MSDETRALEALDNAGMADTQSDDERYYEVDNAFSGRPEAVRFDQVGDMVTGRVVEAFTRQRTKFGTNEPEFWDDGSPKLEPVIVLLTADGLRTLYVGSWRMRKSMGAAFAEAGTRGPRPGGELAVKFTGLEVVKGGQPAKEFEVVYDPPSSNPVRVAVPPAQAGQRLISAECAGGDHVLCRDPRCTDVCHADQGRPGFVPAGQDDQPPF